MVPGEESALRIDQTLTQDSTATMALSPRLQEIALAGGLLNYTRDAGK